MAVVVVTVLVAVGGVAVAGAGAARARRAEVRGRLPASRRPRRLGLPKGVGQRLDAELRAAGLDVSPGEAGAGWAMAIAAAVGFGSVLGPVPAVVLGAGGVALGPIALRAARLRAERQIVAALPTVLDAVAHELRSGGTVDDALPRLVEGRGPLARDLARVLARRPLVGLESALAHWSRERDLEGVRAVAGALAIAARTGGSAAVALEGLAVALRDAIAARAEVRAQAAQARASAWVVGAAPLVYLAFASVVDRASVDVLLTTGLGRACLVAGLGLEAVGIWWMRRLVRSVG